MSNTFFQQLHQHHQVASSSSPDNESVEDFVKKLFRFLFDHNTGRKKQVADLEKEFYSLKNYLCTLVYAVTSNAQRSHTVSEAFFYQLPSVYNSLLKDAAAIAEHDPAAVSVDEVVLAYPGFYAIVVYRIAHELYMQHVDTLPRLFTEYAHRETGIDIHPGACVGEGFFIDHGTGIVIGETAVIGRQVKLFQGVTIGAFLGRHETITKRHPTIEDNVTIYPGAIILGGETVIGKGSTIGGNTWITSSVGANTYVFQKNEELPSAIYTSLFEKQLLTA